MKNKEDDKIEFNTAKNITKDIKEIIKKGENNSLNELVNKMEEYYNKKGFEEKELLRRFNEIEVEKPFEGILLGSVLGAIVAITVVFPGEFIKNINKKIDYMGSLNNIVFFLTCYFLIIMLSAIVSIFIFLGIKKSFKIIVKRSSRKNYLYDKEIIMIKKKIEKNEMPKINLK